MLMLVLNICYLTEEGHYICIKIKYEIIIIGTVPLTYFASLKVFLCQKMQELIESEGPSDLTGS